MRVLTKKDIETLMADYDHDPTGSIRAAIGAMLEISITTWEHMMAVLPPPFSQSEQLARQETAAMDSLVKHLVEMRTL